MEVDGRRVDVGVVDGTVRSIGATGTSTRTSGPTAGADQVIDGGGAALLPGLHDHHVHLHAMAARLAGVDLDPLPGPTAVDAALRDSADHRRHLRRPRWLTCVPETDTR